MPSDFLTRSIDLLGPDGALRRTGLTELALSQPTVLIARERCRFELFRAPPGLTGGPALAAARIHAQAQAPYELAGGCMARKGGLFGLWWWDASWVTEQLGIHGLGPQTRVLPEAMAQPEADGWRVVKGASGYEAQAWMGGFLTGSSWRRRPFDAPSWSAFTRMRQEAYADAPEAPPAPQALPYTWRSPYRRTLVTAQQAAGPLPLVASIAGLLLLGTTALMLGQGLALKHEHAAVRQQLAFLQGRPQANQQPRLAAEAQKLRLLQALTARPDPLMLVGQAQRILRPFNLKIIAFEANPQEVTVTVPGEAVAGIDLLTEELEASPYFTRVTPSLDRQKRLLILKMGVKGAPPVSKTSLTARPFG